MIENQWIQNHKITLIVGAGCFFLGWGAGYLQFKNSHEKEMAAQILTRFDAQVASNKREREKFDQDFEKRSKAVDESFTRAQEHMKKLSENTPKFRSRMSGNGSEQ